MKKKALKKEFYMEIRRSLGRFLSIFFIVAIGVSFFSGIRAAEPDMRYSGDAYFDEKNLMDIQVMSTLGLTDEDIKVLKQVDGIENVEAGYSTDALCAGTESQAVLHIMSMLPSMNELTLEEGRLPEKPDECAVDADLLAKDGFLARNGYQIGDTIRLTSGTDDPITDTLTGDTFTIVGSVSSPNFISFGRGNTTIGTGSVSGFAAVLPESFEMDVYTELYATVDGAKELTAFTDEYTDHVEQVLDELEERKEERQDSRTKEIREEAETELADGKQELADAKAEAQTELADAKQQIDDGWKQLNDGKAQLASSYAELESSRETLAAGEAEIAQNEKLLSEKTAELETQQETLNEKQRELDGKLAELEGSQSELDVQRAIVEQNKAALDQKQQQLNGSQTALDAQKTELDAQWAQLAESQEALEEQSTLVGVQESQLNELKAQYQALLESGTADEATLQAMEAKIAEGDAALAAAKEQLSGAQTQLTTWKSQLDAAQAQLDAGQAALTAGQEELNAGYAQLTQAQTQLDEGQAQIDSGRTQISEGQAQLDTGKAALESGKTQLADAKSQLETAKQEIADGRAQLTSGEQKIAEAESEIAENEQKLNDAQKEYDDGKAEADAEIADAEAELADAETEIAKIEPAKWYINSRDDLTDYTGYGENADRMRAIGKVFPVLFFLVAALISLTTMTRMVEEQRTQIGTLKALGYDRRSIAAKYLGYATLATVTGSIVGILFGEKVFPYIIITAYGIMYPHMHNVVIPYNLEYALMASMAALVCTLFATIFSCYRELREQAAELMRPPAPKNGKRVLLERMTWIWSRLSFTWKATIRNLVRYKKRFFMTVFGISGCMALLLVGFGLKDSIFDIGKIQYHELSLYNGNVVLNEEASEEEQDAAVKKLDADKRVKSTAENLLTQVTISNGKEEKDVFLNVPKEEEHFSDFVVNRDRITKEQYTLDDSGVILTEKAAKELEVKAGDTIYVVDDEKGEIPYKIAAVCENYMMHYLYMTADLYQNGFEEEPDYNSVYYIMQDGKIAEAEDVGGSVIEEEGALSVSYTTNVEEQLDDMLGSLNIVIVVLVISAGMLAFVVLYNLNNINITERKRELATLKVLGFYPMEVAEYVYRENVILTVIGAIVGILLGKILHRFIIVTVEIDTAMFGRNIDFSSFVYGFLITVGFSVLVNAVMYFKLKKIDMIESLKSVE